MTNKEIEKELDNIRNAEHHMDKLRLSYNFHKTILEDIADGAFNSKQLAEAALRTEVIFSPFSLIDNV